MSKLVIDIECSGLLSEMLDYTSFPYKLRTDARLWCVVINNVDTGEIVSAKRDGVTRDWLQEALKDCTLLIGHNIIKFDLPILKLFGVLDYKIGYLNQADTVFEQPVKVVDTLIISRLLNPDRFGGHSLGNWGQKLGEPKIDFRQLLIDRNYIDRYAEKGAEFKIYSPEMLEYCIGDTKTNSILFKELIREADSYTGWAQPAKLENKLADLAVKRENLGFWFDKEAAIKCVADLTEKMQALEDKVNPLLPAKPMNKGELSDFTPPKIQILKDNSLSGNVLRFASRIGGDIISNNGNFFLKFEGNQYQLPHSEPLKTHVKADINDLDHVKMYLIELGWEPTEWRERDLTKNSKKQNIDYDKRVAALNRWAEETLAGKYKVSRLKLLELDESEVLDELKKKLKGKFPVRVPTSPCVRVGVEKELCPSLSALGEQVEFAKDFSLYLTYKHRKASIAGDHQVRGHVAPGGLELGTTWPAVLSCARSSDSAGRVM